MLSRKAISYLFELFAASWLKFVVEDEESKVDSKTAEKKLEVQLEKVCKNEVKKNKCEYGRSRNARNNNLGAW